VAPSYWGFGPIITAPSASDAILGTGKVLLVPTFVVVAEPGHWVIGLLANNQWSVGGIQTIARQIEAGSTSTAII